MKLYITRFNCNKVYIERFYLILFIINHLKRYKRITIHHLNWYSILYLFVLELFSYKRSEKLLFLRFLCQPSSQHSLREYNVKITELIKLIFKVSYKRGDIMKKKITHIHSKSHIKGVIIKKNKIHIHSKSHIKGVIMKKNKTHIYTSSTHK